MEIRIFLSAICFFLLMPLLYAETLMQLMKERYEYIEAIEASFRQKIYISSMQKERESEGKFFYKKGRGFLWKYEKPEEKLFLFDGKFLWQEEKRKPYVIKENITERERTGTFFDIVEDLKNIDELLDIKKEYKEEGILEALPKRESNIRTIRLHVDKKGIVKKIEFDELVGNKNIIEFSDMKINSKIEDGKFSYKLPKDKEIREKR